MEELSKWLHHSKLSLKNKDLVELLKRLEPLGIKELVQSGAIAIELGDPDISRAHSEGNWVSNLRNANRS